MKILVYGYGNPGRQDDGLGPRLCSELETWVSDVGLDDVTFDSNYQLNAEDALTISEFDTVIFSDATRLGEDSFEFKRIEPANRIAFSTHAMNPETVLALCEELYGRRPSAWILSIKGAGWEPNAPMSTEAEKNLAFALGFMQTWLRQNTKQISP
jgi:hydrogenase maturation protease